MSELREEVRQSFLNLLDFMTDEERYCDGCLFLQVNPPFRGITTADVNVWRDGYKGMCNYYNNVRVSDTRDRIPRIAECLISGTKEVAQ